MRYSVLVAFFLLLFTSACSFSLAADVTPPPGSQVSSALQASVEPVNSQLYPLVAPNLQNGSAIYADKCAPCHGGTGMGDGPRAAQLPYPAAPLGSPDFARQSTPADWYVQVTQGNLERLMPPFSSLSDRERWDVVAYAYSLSVPAATIEKGKALFQENCARCHGSGGKGDGPDAATLTTKPADLTSQALMSEKKTADFYQVISEGFSPDMPAFTGKLSDAERWALADYLRMIAFSQPGSQAEAAQAGPTEPAPQASAQAAPAATDTAGSLSSTGTPAAVQEGPGTVTGQVTNGSGGALPKDMVVTLHGFDDMTSVLTDTTTVKPDGTFTFDNVKMKTGRSFLAAVQYGDATYGSDVSVVEQGKNSISLPVTVYDTTTDASILVGDRMHLFFEFLDEKTVRVIELYILSNPTNKTLVAKEPGQPTITFKLPPGATNLEFQDGAIGDRYIETADGFGDTAAVRPGSGSYQELFAFQMPYDRKLDLVQPVTLPVNAVVILIPEGSMKIKSDMLQDGGVRDVEGTQYRTYTSGALSPGQELRLTLNGRPASSAASLGPSSSTNLIIGLGVFGLALVLAGVWLYTRSRQKEDEPQEIEEVTGNTENAETVMDAILALDDLYQAGELPDEAYRQRRAELKARLKELTDL